MCIRKIYINYVRLLKDTKYRPASFRNRLSVDYIYYLRCIEDGRGARLSCQNAIEAVDGGAFCVIAVAGYAFYDETAILFPIEGRHVYVPEYTVADCGMISSQYY